MPTMPRLRLTRRYARLCLLCCAALVAVTMFTGSARADAEWTVARMNEVISQTNFVVGEGCSGTLISLDHKLVLTNHHCIDGYVKFVEREEVQPDGTVVKVKRQEKRDVPLRQVMYQGHRNVGDATLMSEIVWDKKTSDLALLQIRADDTRYTVASPVLPEGLTVERGEVVWIVGNPYGLDATVMRGIVSSVTRMFRVPWADNAEVPFIQTDAGITGGNSGGSMYNGAGFLVGVPAAGVPGTVLGLAIPYTTIQEFLDEACYGELFRIAVPNDPDAAPVETHGECLAREEAEAEAKAAARAGTGDAGAKSE